MAKSRGNLLWRAVLVLVRLDESRFTRQLDTFRIGPIVHVVEFDSSLRGAGILWFNRDSRGDETLTGCSSICLKALQFGSDASFQNLAEFGAAIPGHAKARVDNARCAGSVEISPKRSGKDHAQAAGEKGNVG